jgi:hypothetical protein
VGVVLNGGVAQTASTTGAPASSNAVFAVGARIRTDSPQINIPINGRIDELARWNRLLTADEIAARYNSGLGVTYPIDGIVLSPIYDSADLVTATAYDPLAIGAIVNQRNYRYEAMASHEVSGTTYQALTYWDESGYLVIATRVLDSTWTFFTYNGTGGLPTISLLGADFHYVANLGIDSTGIIHISYNMHNSPLVYRKSTNAIDSFDGALSTTLSMLGAHESKVSYPSFVKDPAGVFYFMFRDGESGVGDLFMYQYSTGAGAQGGPLRRVAQRAGATEPVTSASVRSSPAGPGAVAVIVTVSPSRR